jgi:hypothetical protein
MTEAVIIQRGRTPWIERVYDAFPVAPAWVGTALAAALITTFLASEYAMGRHELLVSGGDLAFGLRDFRVAVVLCLLVAYLPTASVYLLRGARRSLMLLRPVLDPTGAEVGALAGEVGAYPRWGVLAACLLGTGLMLLVPLLVEPGAEYAYQVRIWSPEMTWHRVLAPVMGWWFGRFTFSVVAESIRLSRASRHLAPIDLLDLRPLAPFARQGLANAFWMVGCFSITALLVLEAGFLAVVAWGGTLALALAIASLVLPVRGVHRRIREQKKAELDRVRAAIRGNRSGLVASGIASQADVVSLADLITYEARIESVREWPFDAPTMLRFALYLAIPLGSWLGGAFVERLLGAALD